MNYFEKQETLWFIRGHAERRKEIDRARRKGIHDEYIIALEEKADIVVTALATVGTDIASPSLRTELRNGILLNIYGKRCYPYERLNITGISRRAFYRYRERFIECVHTIRNHHNEHEQHENIT